VEPRQLEILGNGFEYRRGCGCMSPLIVPCDLCR